MERREVPKPAKVPGVVKEIQQLELAQTVAAELGVILTEDSPFNGYIKQVIPHWPDGCDALVDIAVGHGQKQFCPTGSGHYIALNDTTPTFPFNEEVKASEEIWVVIRNRDTENPHSITVIVAVEEK